MWRSVVRPSAASIRRRALPQAAAACRDAVSLRHGLIPPPIGHPAVLWHRSLRQKASISCLSQRLVSISQPPSARYVSTAFEHSVEDIYQKKTPLEHVLLRPGMYIGSVETTKDTMWILSESDVKKKHLKMKQQAVEYVPALYKIFDEIIVNAVDNKVRDPSMQHLDVVIDPGTKANGYKPWISVHNDGRGIPIKFHKHEKVYVPELVLGHLLTGSNFDDSTARLTGGRHGYGAKLTNIFSTEFVVETGDSSTGLKYKQVWKNNMRERGQPEISALGPNESDFTRVSFSPDLQKFEMEKLTTGMTKVLKKRVFDVAGCLSDVHVTLNGQVIPIHGFESYLQTFQHATTTTEEPVEYIYSRVNKRWQVGVLPSDVGFVQVSFVNGMSALRGGTHVNYIAEQLCRRIADHINKKHSELNVTAAQVKPHMALFINCLIENPTFDSQMKEFMSSRPSTFGSSCILSDRFSKLVITNSGIVERVVEAARSKQKAALMKKVSSSVRSKTTVNVPKLEDANWAGGAKSSDCALILTEGDSAKALAVAGLAVVGRDRYGVFPLRGKLLNVRDASVSQLSKNAEFAHLCTILGLQMEETYDSTDKRAQLRYGKVILMTDQDHDGSHIKGLFCNLLHTFWPQLLESGDFVYEFITPIIKIAKRQSKKPVASFFSLPEYFEWKQSQTPEELKKLEIKYYKGLGTSTSAEGREYFKDLDRHLVQFAWSEASGNALEMVFSKQRAHDRKHWLQHHYSPQSFLDTSSGSVSIEDFVNKELIQFSHADNARSLPSVLDGLKISQRKVLFACLKRKLTSKEVKVAQLAGYCSEHTAYHHGEASLHSTIVNMAQDFVGANNLPLLIPSGQFGTRLQGGKDAASPRYIFTLLQKYTRLVFPEDDDALLTYVDDDGFPVEPTHYVPIVPMVLINGSEGIGTGWSTSIPSHHPIEIIDQLIARLNDAIPRPITLKPWFKGFNGTIEPVGDNLQSFVTRGCCERLNATTIRITELPIGKWVEDYKKLLWDLVAKKQIRSFSEHHTERDVRFDVVLSRQDVHAFEKHPDEWKRKVLKLESTLSIANMHAFDANGQLCKYESAMEMIEAFYDVRLRLYERRKAFLEDKQTKDVRKLANRIRFITQVAEGDLAFILKSRLTKHELAQVLRERAYAPSSAFSMESESPNDDDGDFDYLMNTSLLSFTKEMADKLQREHDHKAEKLVQLQATSPRAMWKQELEELRAALLQDRDFNPQ